MLSQKDENKTMMKNNITYITFQFIYLELHEDNKYIWNSNTAFNDRPTDKFLWEQIANISNLLQRFKEVFLQKMMFKLRVERVTNLNQEKLRKTIGLGWVEIKGGSQQTVLSVHLIGYMSCYKVLGTVSVVLSSAQGQLNHRCSIKEFFFFFKNG